MDQKWHITNHGLRADLCEAHIYGFTLHFVKFIWSNFKIDHFILLVTVKNVGFIAYFMLSPVYRVFPKKILCLTGVRLNINVDE